MSPALRELWSEWTFGREHVKAFVQELQDTHLDQQLPRSGLDTIRKHVEELICVQADYMRAIRTGDQLTLSYKSDAETFAGTTPKADLLATMDRLDSELKSLLEADDGSAHLTWFDGTQCSAFQFIAALIGHEAMHIGQIIAFCYAEHLPLPASVANTMGLSG